MLIVREPFLGEKRRETPLKKIDFGAIACFWEKTKLRYPGASRTKSGITAKRKCSRKSDRRYNKTDENQSPKSRSNYLWK
ncbi:MAG: hypothetical protein SXA11_00010 [Cyanobacteriota bacterium]|nr:hypothetical protein [Cyanobacteriota bacterium]